MTTLTEYVVHNGGSELEIKVTLHPLLSYGLSHALGVSALKLSGEEVTEPPLQQRGHASHEEQPDTPTRCPEAAAWPLTHRTLTSNKNA